MTRVVVQINKSFYAAMAVFNCYPSMEQDKRWGGYCHNLERNYFQRSIIVHITNHIAPKRWAMAMSALYF
jgi:hypothetical protein